MTGTLLHSGAFKSMVLDVVVDSFNVLLQVGYFGPLGECLKLSMFSEVTESRKGFSKFFAFTLSV